MYIVLGVAHIYRLVGYGKDEQVRWGCQSVVRKLKHCVTANVAPIIVLLFKEQHLHVDMIIFFFALFYFDVATFLARGVC